MARFSPMRRPINSEVSRRRRKDSMIIRRTVLNGVVSLTALIAALGIPGWLGAQKPAGAPTTPDFSGVYYPINPFGRGGGGRGAGAPAAAAGKQKGPPARPTQSAPL